MAKYPILDPINNDPKGDPSSSPDHSGVWPAPPTSWVTSRDRLLAKLTEGQGEAACWGPSSCQRRNPVPCERSRWTEGGNFNAGWPLSQNLPLYQCRHLTFRFISTTWVSVHSTGSKHLPASVCKLMFAFVCFVFTQIHTLWLRYSAVS